MKENEKRSSGRFLGKLSFRHFPVFSAMESCKPNHNDIFSKCLWPELCRVMDLELPVDVSDLSPGIMQVKQTEKVNEDFRVKFFGPA